MNSFDKLVLTSTLSSVTSSLITHPIDVLRVRLYNRKELKRVKWLLEVTI